MLDSQGLSYVKLILWTAVATVWTLGIWWTWSHT
jgi:hypothetical protein